MAILQKTIRLHRKQAEFRRCDKIFKAFCGGRGAGKALALATPIPTPSGWTAMGDLAIGDKVYDEAGWPCNVTGTTEIMIGRPCYEVLFNDGTKIIADEQHEWLTWTRKTRKSYARRRGGPNLKQLAQCIPIHEPAIVTTEIIRLTLKDCGEVNHSIPVCQPIQNRWKKLPIAPYTLGAWLGDGTQRDAQITSADESILAGVRSEGYGSESLSGKRGKASVNSIFNPHCRQVRDAATGRMISHPDNLIVRLRALGLTEKKHIPSIYLRSSERQRRSLLMGLMDTDGSVDEKGRCEFTSVNKRLAEGVEELCRTLGIRANITEGRALLNGLDYGPKYRINFTTKQAVFRLPRKRQRQLCRRGSGKQLDRRYIISVKSVPSVPVRCIQVDSPSHLYLASRSFIPTHNSWVGAYDLIRRAKRDRTYMIASPTGVKLNDETYPTFKAIAEELGVFESVKLSPYPTVKLSTGATVRFRTAEDPEKLRGPNLSGIWMDEASLMHEEAYKIAIACLREAGEQGFLSATFTPKGPGHWTHRVFNTQLPNTAIFRAATDANPFLPKSFRETLQTQYGVGQFARQELAGEFVQMEGAEWGWDLLEQPGRWFKDWPSDIYQWIIALDPSKGISDHPTIQMANRGRLGDWQAYVIIGMGPFGTFWIDADMARRPVVEMVRRGIGLCRQFAPTPILVIEDNDILGLLYDEFSRQIREDNIAIPLIAIRNKINKEHRLKRLGSYLAQKHEKYGLVMKFRESESMRIVMGQMADFPLAEYDDGIDALELGMQQVENLLREG